ncbi:MAG TPA: CFI-box-CTERM domain-containing protein, partial [Nitrosarchaeum sp.]|nr:CFI-box-CTERM domain-containing protein [Nitrosarchaeum sp.]
ATATYGSELAPQVQFLREIRDNTVLSTASGTSFMIAFNSFYYSFSPAVADLERQNPMFKETVKIAIIPLLSSLSLLQYVDIYSEAEILGYGIGIILLNVGMYFVAPVIVIYKIKKYLLK